MRRYLHAQTDGRLCQGDVRNPADQDAFNKLREQHLELPVVVARLTVLRPWCFAAGLTRDERGTSGVLLLCSDELYEHIAKERRLEHDLN